MKGKTPSGPVNQHKRMAMGQNVTGKTAPKPAKSPSKK